MPLDGSQQPAGALPRGPRLAPARLSRSAAGVSGLSFLICLFPASAPFAVSSFPLHLFLSRAEHGPSLAAARPLVQSGRICRTSGSPCVSPTWGVGVGRKSRSQLSSHRSGKVLLVQRS